VKETGKEQEDSYPVQVDTELGATDATGTCVSSDAPIPAAQPLVSTQTETNAEFAQEPTFEVGDARDSAVPATDAPITSEQDRIDAILQKLFFSPKNHLISEGTVYDPSVR